MISFICPKCRQRLESPDSMAGRSESCPQCGNVSIVPSPASAPPAVTPAYPAFPPPVQQVNVTHSLPEGTAASVLGIIGIVLGGIACLTAWIPLVGCFSIPFAFIGLVLGMIGFFIRRPRKATAIAAMIVSGAALLLQLLWFIGLIGIAQNAAKNPPTTTVPVRRSFNPR